LPSAGNAVALFAPVMARLDDMFSSLTALDEAYKDERFEAVERYPYAAITDQDEVTHDNDVVLPLGVTQSPSRISLELISAYVIADQPIDRRGSGGHRGAGGGAEARVLLEAVRGLTRGGNVERDKETEYLNRMRQFLQEKLESEGPGDAVVRRHELEEIAVAVGLDGQRAWHLFEASEGHVWRGQYIPESRSEERGYTAARIWRVHP
jgi:hypothetical protein